MIKKANEVREYISKILTVLIFSLPGVILRIELLNLSNKYNIFPQNTAFLPNSVGCLIMGIVQTAEFKTKYPILALGFTTGFCGSLTTFSSWINGILVKQKKKFIPVDIICGLILPLIFVLIGRFIIDAILQRNIKRKNNLQEQLPLQEQLSKQEVESKKEIGSAQNERKQSNNQYGESKQKQECQHIQIKQSLGENQLIEEIKSNDEKKVFEEIEKQRASKQIEGNKFIEDRQSIELSQQIKGKQIIQVSQQIEVSNQIFESEQQQKINQELQIEKRQEIINERSVEVYVICGILIVEIVGLGIVFSEYVEQFYLYEILFGPLGSIPRFVLCDKLNNKIKQFQIGTFICNLMASIIAVILQMSCIEKSICIYIQFGSMGCLSTVSSWANDTITNFLSSKLRATFYHLTTFTISILAGFIIYLIFVN